MSNPDGCSIDLTPGGISMTPDDGSKVELKLGKDGTMSMRADNFTITGKNIELGKATTADGEEVICESLCVSAGEHLFINRCQGSEGKTKVEGDYGKSYSDSDILRSELYDAGVANPPYPNAAHHIVAANARTADYARTILKSVGIDYNSAANGVFLPYEKNGYVTTETMHVGSHKDSYYEKVNQELEKTITRIEVSGGVVSKEDIQNTLNSIRKGLLDGSIKLN